MSVVDTFIYVFTANTQGLQQGIDATKNSSKGLTTTLDAADTAAKTVTGSIKNLAKQYGALAAGLLSARAIISGFRDAVNYADRLDELSKALNVSVEELSVWGDAVKLSGGTAEGFQSTVETMTASLVNFATKGTSRVAPFFKALGIQMVDARGKARDFFEILPELADAFQGLSKSESFGLGQKIGLDSGTIMLLQQGRRGVEDIIKRQKELGVVTAQDAETAAKFNDAWDDTAHALRSTFLVASGLFLPAITLAVKGVEQIAVFVKNNLPIIISGLAVIGTYLAATIVPNLIRGAIAAVAMNLPFLLLAGTIALVATMITLLVEDIYQWVTGGKSAIGDLANYIYQKFKPVFDFFGKLFKKIGEDFKDVVDFIKSILDFAGKVIDKISKGINKVKSAFGFGKDEGAEAGVEQNMEDTVAKVAQKNIEIAKQHIEVANTTPLAAVNSNSFASATNNNISKNNNVSVGQVVVKTQASDPQNIASDIGRYLDNEIRKAVSNFDDGILA